MKKAIFIDKDGTLIPDIPYNVDPQKICLQEGAAEALKRLQDQGYLLFIISNQPGVALKLFTESSLELVKEKISDLLLEHGILLSGFYYCPHRPETNLWEQCECRKPKPGLILRASLEHDVDTAHSWMVGDILNDVEAGKRAGCHTILFDNGNETEWELNRFRIPDKMVTSLPAAADFILNSSQHVANEKLARL